MICHKAILPPHCVPEWKVPHLWPKLPSRKLPMLLSTLFPLIFPHRVLQEISAESVSCRSCIYSIYFKYRMGIKFFFISVKNPFFSKCHNNGCLWILLLKCFQNIPEIPFCGSPCQSCCLQFIYHKDIHQFQRKFLRLPWESAMH